MKISYSRLVTKIDDEFDVMFVTMEHNDMLVNVHVGHATDSVLVGSNGQNKPVVFTKVNGDGVRIYFDSDYEPLLNWYEYGDDMYVANLGTISITVQLGVARPFYIIRDRKKMLLGLTELPEILDEETTANPFQDAELKLLEILGVDYV
jgi:hypothetical protein